MRIFVLFAAVLLNGVSVPPADASQDGTLENAAPLTLQTALDEALNRNPQLIVLRRQYDALLHRPEQELALAPPSFEAQIWQWPFNTLNPGNTNMYMFTVGQRFPGRGKRGLWAAVANKEAELSQAAIAVRARDVIDQVKRVYADYS